MAKKPTSPAEAGDIPAPPSPDEQFFDIAVSRVASAFGVKFRPGSTYRVKARVADALGDAVAAKTAA